MDALSISSNVELNELDAYVASMKYIYLLVKGIIEMIKNGVNTLMRGCDTYYENQTKLLPQFNCQHNIPSENCHSWIRQLR